MKKLRKNAIGTLEVDILGARELVGMNSYVVAKYGTKWVRTRTLLGTASPQWNEHYTWDVFDTCTVITVAIFENANFAAHGVDGATDQRIGKVHVRLSTLQSDLSYTQYYPLMSLSPSGLKKMGELHLAVRFSCTSWANMLAQYGRPELPKLHYTNPLTIVQQKYCHLQAIEMLAVSLSRADLPMKREVVEYMLEVDFHLFSRRRIRANFHRMNDLFSGAFTVLKWFDGICKWKNPVATMLVHVMFLHLVCYPELILPMIFLFMAMITAWNYRRRLQQPPQIDTVLSYAEQVLPGELDEELDEFPTSKTDDVVRMRYDSLRTVAGRFMTVVGDMATLGEHMLCLLRWHDPRATLMFFTLSLVVVVLVYLTPFPVVAMMVGLYILRPPWFRTRTSLFFNFYRRLPSYNEVLL